MGRGDDHRLGGLISPQRLADLLERVAVAGADVPALIAACSEPPVTGVLVLSTCNRRELYADVSSFHPGMEALLRAVAWSSGVEVAELAATAVVRHDHAAVSHLLTVACGLESIAVGEVQIIGELRTALKTSQQAGRATDRWSPSPPAPCGSPSTRTRTDSTT